MGRAQLPDLADDAEPEAADGVSGRLALGFVALDVVAGARVAAGAGDSDAVYGGVRLAVAAAVQAMALGSSGASGARCDFADANSNGRVNDEIRARLETYADDIE